ncbi:MAG: helix-turn-helix transcriptional regulator [Cyanobacteria bacterium]|nr:helix-turn-helix transcriptional regulator [Cyanobacteriota bacterium]
MRWAMGQNPDQITRSESKVLEQLLLGSSNKSIAAALLLSPRTVESHIANLLAKTGCQSRTQLLLWALDRR